MRSNGIGTRGAARTSFMGTTSATMRLAEGNPTALAQLGVIADRTSLAKEHARNHFAKYEETWVVKEAMNLWKRRSGLASDVASLPAIAKDYTAQRLMTEARRKVRARMTSRLSKINTISTRMGNSVVRNLQFAGPTQSQSPARSRGPTKGSPAR